MNDKTIIKAAIDSTFPALPATRRTSMMANDVLTTMVGKLAASDELASVSSSIPAAQVPSDWNSSTGLSRIINKPTLFSGAYADLSGKPSIPSAQVQTDWNATSGMQQVEWGNC